MFALLFAGCLVVNIVMARQVNPFAERQVIITIPGLDRGAAPMRQRQNAHDTDTTALSQSNEVADPHRTVRPVHPAAVEAHDAALGHRLSRRTALGQARKPQELVDAKAGSMPGFSSCEVQAAIPALLIQPQQCCESGEGATALGTLVPSLTVR